MRSSSLGKLLRIIFSDLHFCLTLDLVAGLDGIEVGGQNQKLHCAGQKKLGCQIHCFVRFLQDAPYQLVAICVSLKFCLKLQVNIFVT